jgi:hypothetical protein
MRLRNFVLLGAGAVAAAACEDDDGVSSVTRGPKAFVRFINAVPDTGTVDFRFVDKVENLPTFLGVTFRGTSGGYQGVDPGTRPVRVFANDTTTAGAAQRLIDTTITLAADARYTLVYAGRARGNADQLAVIEEEAALPTPTAGQIAVKTIHAAVGTGPVDVFVGNSGGNPITAAVTKFSNVGYLATTTYANIATRPTGAGNLYTFAVANAGTTTAAFSATPNMPGAAAPAGQTYGAQPGVQVSGSVLTAVVFPGATPGSRAATSTNQTPSVILVFDKPLNP